MMAKNVGLNLIGCSIIAMVSIIGLTHAINYTVGDSFGWNVPPNQSFYMEWAKSSPKNPFGGFFIGEDNLIFNWTGEHNVAVVGANIYENCNTSTVVPVFSGNGSESFVYNISSPFVGPRYFICSIGNHCARGQKFSITVMQLTDKPNLASPTLSFGILSSCLLGLAVYFFSHIC